LQTFEHIQKICKKGRAVGKNSSRRFQAYCNKNRRLKELAKTWVAKSSILACGNKDVFQLLSHFPSPVASHHSFPAILAFSSFNELTSVLPACMQTFSNRTRLEIAKPRCSLVFHQTHQQCQ